MTWNEFLDHLKGEVQDKSKNPFFGAFIATWVIRHWEVVFTFFYFDKEIKLDEKLKRLNSYFDSLPEGDFWYTILYTFCVILLGYLLLNLARVISNLSEKILTPLIYKWTAGKASIVLKEVYEASLQREKVLRDRIEQNLSEMQKIQEESNIWEKRFKDLLIENTKKPSNKSTSNSSNPELPKSISQTKNIQNSEAVEIDLKPFATATLNKLSISERQMLKEVILKIKNKEVIQTDHYNIKSLVSHNIIEQNGNPINGFAHFKFTKLGEEIVKLN